MATTTVEIGTLSLMDFCGCPSPCPECCAVVTDCCADVPTTLFASCHVTVPLVCATVIITLTWNSGAGYWEGSGTLSCSGDFFTCNTSIALAMRLQCVTVAGIGVWHLITSCDGFTHFIDFNPPTSQTCIPVNIVFGVTSSPTGCEPCGANHIAVTITE